MTEQPERYGILISSGGGKPSLLVKFWSRKDQAFLPFPTLKFARREAQHLKRGHNRWTGVSTTVHQLVIVRNK